MSARKNIDDLLAVKLAGGATFKNAAAELGVDERTARRRAENPVFRHRVDTLRRELVTAAIGRLVGRMAEAADVLGALLESPVENTRLKAAVALLNHASQTALVADVQARLNALEERLNHAGFTQSPGQDRSPTG